MCGDRGEGGSGGAEPGRGEWAASHSTAAPPEGWCCVRGAGLQWDVRVALDCESDSYRTPLNTSSCCCTAWRGVHAGWGAASWLLWSHGRRDVTVAADVIQRLVICTPTCAFTPQGGAVRQPGPPRDVLLRRRGRGQPHLAPAGRLPGHDQGGGHQLQHRIPQPAAGSG